MKRAAKSPDGIDEKIDKIFAAFNRTDSPGGAIAVSLNGETVFAKGYGMASIEHGMPNTPQTVFYIASSSKQFAAAALAIAVIEGKISLQDPLARYFPDFPDYAKSISVKDLVHHTSGLRDYLGLISLSGGSLDQWRSDEWLLALISRQQATNFEPGTKFDYSNTGYLLISELIKKVTGKTLRQFADEKIFRPLGMSHTHFHDDRNEIVRGRATGYAPDPKGGFLLQWPIGFDKVGDGGLLSTVEDLTLWGRNLLDDKLAGGKLVQTILQPGKLANGESVDYAFGLFINQYRGCNAVHHAGGFPGFSAQCFNLPEQRLGIAVLCNNIGADAVGLARQVVDLFLGEERKPKQRQPEAPKAKPKARPASLVGSYRDAYLGQRLDVTAEKGESQIHIMGRAAPMQFANANCYRISGFLKGFDAEFDDADGVTLRHSPDAASAGAVFAKYTRADPWTPNATALADFKGRYYSQELACEYRLVLTKGVLSVQVVESSEPAQEIAPTFLDTFESRTTGGVLSFSRDRKRVTGFALNAGRVIGVKFEKQPD